MTEKYLNDQEDIEELKITDRDTFGRNIFHLSVQRKELLEFLLDKFLKVRLKEMVCVGKFSVVFVGQVI